MLSHTIELVCCVTQANKRAAVPLVSLMRIWQSKLGEAGRGWQRHDDMLEVGGHRPDAKPWGSAGEATDATLLWGSLLLNKTGLNGNSPVALGAVTAASKSPTNNVSHV
jgi:hypothetical protein